MQTISTLAQELAKNPLVVLAGLALTTLSVFLAVFFYFRSKREKFPRFFMRSIILVRDLIGKIEALQLLYSGQPIENVTVTKVALWNSGRETITAADIAPADPFVICADEGVTIRDEKILRRTPLISSGSPNPLTGGRLQSILTSSIGRKALLSSFFTPAVQATA
jgi:hypothetical protein